MLYSSGTTGRPKGIKYKIKQEPIGAMPARDGHDHRDLRAWTSDSVYLSPAPLYHSAPLFYCMSTMRLGGTVIVHGAVRSRGRAAPDRAVPRHAQPVGADDVRAHAEAARRRARRGTTCRRTRSAIHAAAPCPVEVKRQMIEWWGPIIEEYYSATEGMGATFINSEQWLAHPGSVGQTMLAPIHIVDEDGNDAPDRRGRHRVVRAARPSRPGFEYHKDEAKTQETFDAHGWASVGDMGYLDDEGYLYLTDRRTFMIVSGGVNIYPQEAENLLINHPKVFDVAVFGIPDPEMGEKVHARRAADGVGRRRTRARTRAARRTAASTSRTTSARRRSTSTPSCRASRPASSTSACCATATGATRRRASSDGTSPAACIASGRDGDIFEFGPDLVLRRTRDGRSLEAEARVDGVRARTGLSGPRDPRAARGGTEIVMERIDGPLMMDAILQAHRGRCRARRRRSPTCTTSCTRSPGPTGCARCPTAAATARASRPASVERDHAPGARTGRDRLGQRVARRRPVRRRRHLRVADVSAHARARGAAHAWRNRSASLLARAFTKRYRGRALDARIADAAELKTLDDEHGARRRSRPCNASPPRKRATR